MEILIKKDIPKKNGGRGRGKVPSTSADIWPTGLSCSQPVVSEDTLQAQVLWASEILDEEIVPDSQSNFMANPPLIVKATGMTRKYKGCGSPLTDEDKAYPHNMVFRRLAVGGYYNQKYNRYMNQESYIHYHLNMHCLRKYAAYRETMKRSHGWMISGCKH